VSLNVQTNKQTNKKENKNKLLSSAVSATVIRLQRNWSLSNGQQEHEKYKRNKMQADFRRDPHQVMKRVELTTSSRFHLLLPLTPYHLAK